LRRFGAPVTTSSTTSIWTTRTCRRLWSTAEEAAPSGELVGRLPQPGAWHTGAVGSASETGGAAGARARPEPRWNKVGRSQAPFVGRLSRPTGCAAGSRCCVGRGRTSHHVVPSSSRSQGSRRSPCSSRSRDKPRIGCTAGKPSSRRSR
jgi:hypothetical protein